MPVGGFHRVVGKTADTAAVHIVAAPHDIPDHVVGDHGDDFIAPLLGGPGVVLAAVQTLFFTGERGEHQRRWELVQTQYPSQLDDGGRPAPVIVSTGRKSRCIAAINRTAVVMPADDDLYLRSHRPREPCDDISMLAEGP